MKFQRMKQAEVAALLHVVSWCVAALLGMFTKDAIPLPQTIAKLLGFAIFLGGMSLFVWGVAYLKRGFLGNVEPLLSALVTTGLYRFVRHPVCLGMFVCGLGLVIGMRSLVGVLAMPLFFLPSTIHRARLEEESMALKFGGECQDYRERTCFLLPLIWQHPFAPPYSP